ncbi:hypothetical protein GCM10010377_65910 [Streptomyces viridiviolaceus]|nr:hypothetical protein GCM10010377_65910 [Streptomyces viridiviolaceus]
MRVDLSRYRSNTGLTWGYLLASTPRGTVAGMPALNVEFSDRELEDLRQIAKERGTSMKALVREAAAADIARHRALQEGAEAFRRFFQAHADEFAAAFPDDEPPARGEGRAA